MTAMTTMSRALLPALALLLVPTAAYAGDTFEPTAADDPTVLAAWRSWDEKGIDDYTTTVALSCFCPERPVVRTVVRDGEIRRVLQGGRRLGHGRGYSMDDLFWMIREAHESADRVEVTYSPRGVPKSIAIDPERLAADEETYYTVSLVRS
jgi:hypothetical protein